MVSRGNIYIYMCVCVYVCLCVCVCVLLHIYKRVCVTSEAIEVKICNAINDFLNILYYSPCQGEMV